jgi:two-component system response regulator YesN
MGEMVMIGVLLVDDEILIREGLKQSIDWNGLGLEVIGEADNGIDAIRSIADLNPSIVITDIKMPGKTGLDVMQYAMQFNSEIKVIILSGYSDFEYARQAMKWGAFDFILKPTVFSEVIDVITRAARSILLERKSKDNFDRYKAEMKQNIDFYRRAFLHKVITIPQLDDHTRINLRETLELYEMKEDGPVHLMLWKIDEFDTLRYHSEEKMRISLLALEHQTNEFFQSVPGAYTVPVREDLFAVVLRIEALQTEQQMTQLCEEFQTAVKTNYLPMTLSVGIGSSKSSILELHKGYVEAYAALEHILYLGNEAVIFYDGLYRFSGMTETPYLVFAESCRSIVKSLQVGDRESSSRLLEQLFGLFKYHQVNKETVKGVCIELSALIYMTMNSPKHEDLTAQKESFYLEIMNCETSEKYYQLIHQLIMPMAEDIFRKTHTNHKKIVRQVLDLISEHYMNNVTLSWIASQVHLNTSYLSRLLKNECGENFSVLLTKYRIEKAKECLKDPTVKIYEVSDKLAQLSVNNRAKP